MGTRVGNSLCYVGPLTFRSFLVVVHVCSLGGWSFVGGAGDPCNSHPGPLPHHDLTIPTWNSRWPISVAFDTVRFVVDSICYLRPVPPVYTVCSNFVRWFSIGRSRLGIPVIHCCSVPYTTIPVHPTISTTRCSLEYTRSLLHFTFIPRWSVTYLFLFTFPLVTYLCCWVFTFDPQFVYVWNSLRSTLVWVVRFYVPRYRSNFRWSSVSSWFWNTVSYRWVVHVMTGSRFLHTYHTLISFIPLTHHLIGVGPTVRLPFEWEEFPWYLPFYPHFIPFPFVRCSWRVDLLPFLWVCSLPFTIRFTFTSRFYGSFLGDL